MSRLTRVNECGDIYASDEYKDMDCDDWDYMALKKLVRYEKLEESGLIPILYIGQDIYFRVKGMNQFGAYVDFIQTQKIGRIDIDINGILYCTASVKFIISDLGKSVFLTREEAELKLKEKEN